MAAEVGTLKLGDWLATYTWTLDLALLRGKKPEESIRSPCFTTLIPDNGTAEWYIQLYPNGINRKSKGYLSIYLNSTECKVLECKSFLVYFSIMDNNKKDFQDVPVEESSLGDSKIRGIEKFIKRDLLTAGTSYFYHNTSQLVLDGKINIRCSIKMSTNIELPKPIPPPQDKKPNLPLPMPRRWKSLSNLLSQSEDENSDVEESTKILDDFDSLLIHGRADVKLIARGQQFHAHKAVLAARSTVFASQFEKDKLEGSRISVIDTGDLDPEVLKKVMRFVYIGKIINLDESAHEMLGSANKYALEDLKDLCEDAMIKHLSIFNASDYLVLSFNHEASRLRAHAMDFVVDNCKDIMETPGFKNMAGSHASVIAAMFAALGAREKLK